VTRFQKIRIGLLATTALAFVAFWIAAGPKEHRIRLIACFENVRGLRAGGGVQISGVDVGHTTSVESHPERKDCLAEVKMTLDTSYELRVPSDAIARVERAGLLGDEFVDIDVRAASAPPIRENGHLKTAPTSDPLEAVKAAVKAAAAQCADCESKQQARPASKP